MLRHLWRDIRTATRSLLKAPAFAGVTVLTLAVAIGANTAIFSVVDGVLLRPLPYPEADRLVTISARTMPRNGNEGGELPYSDRGYWHFHDNGRAWEQFGGYSFAPIRWALTGEGAPLQVDVAQMTSGAFELLGTAPQRGRLPTAEEDVPDGPRLVVLGDALWQGAFGADPAVIGRSIELNGFQWQVIGIMPPGYDFPTPEIDAWVPMQLDPTSTNFGGHYISGIARMTPDATVESARADAGSLIGRFGEVGYGPTWFTGVFTGEAVVRTLKEEVVGDSRQPLLILLGTMAFVLLIACSNVANLFLVRSEARTRETAVRVALGSGRGRLVQFVLTESVLLGLIGGALGVLLAWGGTRLLVATGPASVPRLGEIGMSGTVLAFTAGISILAGLLFGAIPALRTGRPRMLAALRDGGRGGALGMGEHRTRNVLVVSQVALALVLLVGSGLMVRSFQQLRAVHPGFDTGEVLTFGLSPTPVKFDGPEPIARFYDQLLDDLEAIPGVTRAGAVTQLPLTGGGARLTTRIDEFPPAEDEFPPVFHIRRAMPGYFEAMGMPLVEGRTFTSADHEDRLGSLIISASIKDQYWPNTSALGKRITTAGAPARVVGVVGDVHDTGLDAPVDQVVYKPMLDSIGGGALALSMVVRSDADPLALVPEIRRIVEGSDPDLPITDLRTMASVVGDSVSRTSFTMTLLALGAVIALFLGAVGVYGVISYLVVRRRGEIGVRQALGAGPGSVRNLVLWEGMRLGVLGIVVGLVAALLMGRVIASLLYGVSPYDGVSLVGGSFVFLVVAALASAIPASRAAGIPPALALRGE